MKEPLFERKVLSQKILQFKEKYKLTYRDIGKAIGVNQSYINRVAKMSSFVSMPVLVRLAKFMKVPLYALFIPSEELIREEFIKRVQAKMKEKNLSLDELAKQTGMSPVRLNGIANGKLVIKKAEYDILAESLEIIKEPYQCDNMVLFEEKIDNLSIDVKHKENVLKYIKDHL